MLQSTLKYHHNIFFPMHSYFFSGLNNKTKIKRSSLTTLLFIYAIRVLGSVYFFLFIYFDLLQMYCTVKKNYYFIISRKNIF